MKKYRFALVCGLMMLGCGIASAESPKPTGTIKGDKPVSENNPSTHRPELLASSKEGSDSAVITQRHGRPVIDSTYQDDAISALPQPRTYALLLAGLIAVLYVALRRRPPT